MVIAAIKTPIRNVINCVSEMQGGQGVPVKQGSH